MNRPAPGKAYSTVFRTTVLACFFLSGAAGLVYEVVWARQLSLFLGITSFAHTAVITAYMAGLAAGSLYFGRRADRSRNPLRVYAWLEIGVGVYAALTPAMFDGLQSGYAAVAGVAGISGMPGHLTRFAIALAALLVPTFLMGGTLPLLVRGFVRSLPELGKATSRLYGLNTLGAMTGTLLAGYLLLPRLGITLAIFCGVVVNIGIAVLVLWLTRERSAAAPAATYAPAAGPPPESAGPDASGHPPLSPAARLAVLVAFGLAGFAALLTQLAWIRALILVVGGSVYAFTITLASFLAGIGLGSLAYTRFLSAASPGGGAAVNQRRMIQAAVLAGLIGFTVILGLPLIGKLPEWFLAGYSAGLQANFNVFQVFIFSLSFSVMILPTLCMGALFPLVTVIWTRSGAGAGRGVGTAYAINTTGTILGALLGGLFILPWLGIHHSIQLTAGIYVLAGALFWWFGSGAVKPLTRSAAMLAVVAVFGLVAWKIPPWDRAVMASGVFYRSGDKVDAMAEKTLDEVVNESKLLYYKEGLDGTVSVRESAEQRSLVVNGKSDASSVGDLPTQVLLGQLPMLLHRNPARVLVIGMGSGITAGSVATDEDVESITILEISNEVVEASRFFNEQNYDVLADVRVNMVTADARNFVLASDEQYDVIISEPSNPWISGVSNLFTAEFFAQAKQKLAPGGVMTQWFHTYGMSTGDLRSILKTFSRNFRHVSVWRPLFGDLVLVGSDTVQEMDWREVNAMSTRPDGNSELQRIGGAGARDLAKLFVFGNPELSEYARGAELNADDFPVIEFNAPRYLYDATTELNMNDIFAYLDGTNLALPFGNLYERKPGLLDVHAMGLEIALPGDRAATDIQAQWQIGRQLFVQDDRPAYGSINQHYLVWKEDAYDLYLQSGWQEHAPDRGSLFTLLNQVIRPEGAQGGAINVTGATGVWMANAETASGILDLGIAWSCPDAAGGFVRYAFLATLPDPGVDLREGLITEQAARFRCKL